ncbi:hypothetical protein KFL_010280010, partial [Klebsormidium nitens]
MREWKVRKASQLRAEWVFLKDLAAKKDAAALGRLLEKCWNARAVSLEGDLVDLPGEVASLKEIVFFRYHGGRLSKCLPSGVGKWKHLSALDLEGAKLPELCEETKEWTEIEVLRLRDCAKLAVLPNASMGAWQQLRTLILSGCSSLTSLPPEIETCTQLQTVDLSRCKALAELPNGIGAWGGSLTSLRLAGCSLLEGLPESVTNWSSLQTISLAGAKSLKRLPEGVRGWMKVQRVNLKGCAGLEGLPEGVVNWEHLTSIVLIGCPGVTSLPKGVTEWAAANNISIGCSNLPVLPPLRQDPAADGFPPWWQLETLDLSGCGNLQELPLGLGNLPYLSVLNLTNCSSLTSLPEEVGQLALTSLYLDGCKNLSLTRNEICDLLRGSEMTLYWLFTDGCPAFEEALKLPLLAEVSAFFLLE